MHMSKTRCLVFSAFLAAAMAGCSTSSPPEPDEPAAGGDSGSGSGASGGSSPSAAGGRSSGREADASSGAPSGGSASGGSGAGGSSAGADGGSSPGGSGATDAGMEMDAASSSVADPAAGVFPIPPGLTKIFDGTSLTGWDGDARWSVNAADMAIQGRTGGGNLIKTKMDYGDFRLILTERMVLPGPSTNHLGECFWGGAYQA